MARQLPPPVLPHKPPRGTGFKGACLAPGGWESVKNASGRSVVAYRCLACGYAAPAREIAPQSKQEPLRGVLQGLLPGVKP